MTHTARPRRRRAGKDSERYGFRNGMGRRLSLGVATVFFAVAAALATDNPTPLVVDTESPLGTVPITAPPVFVPGIWPLPIPTPPPWPGPTPTPYPIEPPPSTCSIGGPAIYRAMAPAVTANPIYLRKGAVLEQAVDLRLPGPVPGWVATRTYSSVVDGSAALGGKWLNNFVDYRLVEEDFGNIALIVDATSKRVFEYNMMDGSYTSPSDSTLSLVYDGTNAEFVLTDWVTGEVNIFYNMSASHPGRLKEKTTQAWRDAGKTGSTYTYNTSNQVTQITTAQGQDYNVVISYTGSKITKMEVRTGADSSTRIRQVEYTYFDSQTHSADVGTTDDLVQVKFSALKSDGSAGTSSDWIVRYCQYRYDSNGLLKAVFDHDAIARLIADRSDVTSADDILTLGDDDDDNGNEDHKIKDYASRRFTYYTVNLKTDNSGAGTSGDPKCVTVWNSSGEDLETTYGGSDTNEVDSTNGIYLVKSETVGSCSSCGGTGSVTHDYFYMDIDHGTPDVNEVVRLVVEDTSDSDGNGIVRKVYGLSDTGQRLRAVTITDPTGTPSFWCQSWKLESSGQKLNHLAEYRTSAAHNVTSSTVDEFLDPVADGDWSNDNSTLNTSSGLIRVYEYNTSGDRTGTRVKQGRTGTSYYVSATDYYGGTNENQKHLVTYRYQYSTATTDRAASSRIATQYSYTFWIGTDVVKKRTATLPAVATGENGSNATTTTEEYYDSRGRLRWTKDAAGYVNYYSYHPENGQLAYALRDADPTSLPTSADSNSTKWVTSSDGSASSNKPTRGTGLGTAIEQVTFQEYDDQGRLTLRAS